MYVAPCPFLALISLKLRRVKAKMLLYMDFMKKVKSVPLACEGSLKNLKSTEGKI